MVTGKTLFRAYSIAVGDKTWDGKPIPNWNDLGDKIRNGWETAAQIATECDDATEAVDLDDDTIRAILDVLDE